MFSHRWYEYIQKPFDPESIKAEAERYESRYWSWLVINIGLVGAGLAVYLINVRTDGAIGGLGLILLLFGLINTVLMKIWAHVMLSMFRLALWSGKR